MPPFLAILACISLGVAAQADLFVSPTGDDTNPGTRSRPFATLEAARDVVRQLKANRGIPKGGLAIWLRAGTYVRTQAFVLGPEDSGAQGAPIVYRNWKKEPVRLLGGRVLPPFQPIADPAVRARLTPAAQTRVRQCDLRSLGIPDTGSLRSRGFGRATVPAHAELFHGARPMTLARWPNEGEFARIAGFPDTGAKDDEHGGKIGQLENGFLFSCDRPSRWKDPSQLWVHGYWCWDWANSYEQVASIHADLHLLKTAPPHGLYGFRSGQRFYFLNVLEELDEPGEWFIDRPKGLLYFWPPAPGQRGPPPETVLSLLDQPLVVVRGASQVVLQGLVLEATRGSAVEVRGGEANRVLGCLIRNVGNHGVLIEGGRQHGVVACDIFATGDGGVSLIGGDRSTLQPGGHFVENCHFARQGRWSKCYVPAVHLQGVGLRATHNLIHDHPHCAILFTGNDHLIEFNEIHHIALETGDVGAIYTGRDYTFRGNRIRHNFIHHTGGVGMGSMGVYMDDCASGTEIFGNIFCEVQRAAFLGGGRDHQVINNVFVRCNHAVELDGRGLDPSPVWHAMVDQTMRQRLAEIPAALYRARYPELRDLDASYGPPGGPPITGTAFKGVPPDHNRVARNVCVGNWTRVGWHARPEMLQQEQNLVRDDPGFLRVPGPNSPATDFALRPDSEAWKLGFQGIPVHEIGLVPDDLRRTLENPKRRFER